MKTNVIYNMDCLEYMKQVPNKYFDLIITDPPYGINYGGQLKGKGDGKGGVDKNGWREWDAPDWDERRPSKEVFKEMLRISKNQVIWGGNYFADILDPKQCWLVWDKGQREFSLADAELAWTSFDSSVRVFTMSRGQFMYGLNENRKHPTQKPVALGRWILNKYAQKGDKIMDPFMGSGSFIVACKQLGYEYVGCELEPKYCKIAENRLKQGNLQDILKGVCKREGGSNGH